MRKSRTDPELLYNLEKFSKDISNKFGINTERYIALVDGKRVQLQGESSWNTKQSCSMALRGHLKIGDYSEYRDPDNPKFIKNLDNVFNLWKRKHFEIVKLKEAPQYMEAWEEILAKRAILAREQEAREKKRKEKEQLEQKASRWYSLIE